MVYNNYFLLCKCQKILCYSLNVHNFSKIICIKMREDGKVQ